jgi:uncharacterized membrane protein YgcG
MESMANRSIVKWPLLAAGVLWLSGCADWGSEPFRVQRDYGTSVREMVANQIYDPRKALHPAPSFPDGIEGNKGDRVLEQAYRTDIGSPQRVRTTRDINGGVGGGLSGNSNGGGGGSSGGSSR